MDLWVLVGWRWWWCVYGASVWWGLWGCCFLFLCFGGSRWICGFLWIVGFGGVCSTVVVGWGCWFFFFFGWWLLGCVWCIGGGVVGFFYFFLFFDGLVDLWCGSRRRERERERERIKNGKKRISK